MPFHFGSRSRMESSTTQSSATATSSAHHTRQRTNSYKPLKGILKPAPPPENPVKIPLFAPRPRKLSRASPVEVMEDAVLTRTSRPPSRMATPSQQNPPSMQPSGWPHHYGPIPSEQAPIPPSHHVFPSKPRRSSTQTLHTPAYPPGVPLPPNTQYVYNVHAVQPAYAFPPKPHPERPSTAAGTTQVFAPKPSKQDRSRHHSRKEGERKGKGKEKEKEKKKDKENESTSRHREHGSRNHDRQRSRDEDSRRDGDRRGGAQTDTEEFIQVISAANIMLPIDAMLIIMPIRSACPSPERITAKTGGSLPYSIRCR
ncbi:hypothetical protein BDZ89DRAFT_33773 [Hymenopellis radicata]|nr:hypothetical protein BDZ89DRAFT_33773 [Hymenopellis radicata]